MMMKNKTRIFVLTPNTLLYSRPNPALKPLLLEGPFNYTEQCPCLVHHATYEHL